MTEKVVSAEVIDRAWMRSQSVAIGPVGLMDLFGLDVIFDSWQRPGRRNHPLRPRILAQLAPLIESNALGIKSGQGFYSYPDPSYAQADFLVGTTNDKTIESCLVAVFLTHAVALEVNGVTEGWKVDEAWTLSFGYSEGPFAQLQALGIPALKKYQDEALRRGLLDGDVLSLVSEHFTNTASPS
jgi:3-hydroxybutyryl-CoA dehydrogenase